MFRSDCSWRLFTSRSIEKRGYKASGGWALLFSDFYVSELLIGWQIDMYPIKSTVSYDASSVSWDFYAKPAPHFSVTEQILTTHKTGPFRPVLASEEKTRWSVKLKKKVLGAMTPWRAQEEVENIELCLRCFIISDMMQRKLKESLKLHFSNMVPLEIKKHVRKKFLKQIFV